MAVAPPHIYIARALHLLYLRATQTFWHVHERCVASDEGQEEKEALSSNA